MWLTRAHSLRFRLIGLGLLINLLIVGMISLVTLDAVHEVARNDLGKQLGTLDRQASAALTRPAAEHDLNTLYWQVEHFSHYPDVVYLAVRDRDVLGDAAEPVTQEIRLIDEQVHRIRIIVTKLLQFARPGEFAGYVEVLDVGAVISDCLVLAQHHLSKCNIAVAQRFEASEWVSINRHELQQVLINLIVNAVQAMPDGGTLTLSTDDWRVDGVLKGVRVGVRDTGKGIDPADLHRVFDPFFTTKKSEGTGLGLSISHSLIKRYGGSITVESAPGQGAEFVVWLLIEPEYETEARA